MKLVPIDRAFNDWDALQSLILASFADMHARIDPPSSALRLKLQSLKQRAETEKAYAVIENGRLAGCIFCKPEPPDFLYIASSRLPRRRRARALGG